MMPHGTRLGFRVNAQPSTGPAAGRISPDPEQHHPELGTARQHAAQQAAEANPNPAIPIQAGAPSPRPGAESPAHLGQPQAPALPEHQERWQLPGRPGPDLPFPLDISEHLPPIGRVQSQNAWMPRQIPARPHSPSNAYVPGLNADRGTEDRLREMVDHKFTTGESHPALPAGPTGELTLGRQHSDALISFRNQVLAQPDPNRQYAQTYRIEEGRFVPNHPNLIQGNAAETAMPRGSYPAGTGLVIRSFHPDHATGMPGEADILRAYQDRTNFLHEPGTNVAGHILFNPRDDSAFLFDGSLDAHGAPQYFGLAVTPQSIAQPAARNPVHERPDWLDARTPQMPAVATPAFAPTPASAPRASAQPPSPASPRAEAISETPRDEAPAFFFPQRPESPRSPMPAAESPIPQSPKWDEWLDFNPPSPKPGQPGAAP